MRSLRAAPPCVLPSEFFRGQPQPRRRALSPSPLCAASEPRLAALVYPGLAADIPLARRASSGETSVRACERAAASSQAVGVRTATARLRGGSSRFEEGRAARASCGLDGVMRHDSAGRSWWSNRELTALTVAPVGGYAAPTEPRRSQIVVHTVAVHRARSCAPCNSLSGVGRGFARMMCG